MNRDMFAWLVDCHWCGEYRISLTIAEDTKADEDSDDLLPYLAAHIRQSQSSRRVAEVPPDWKTAALAHANTTIAQRVRLLLEWIARRSRVGQTVDVMEDEIAPWIDARDQAESRYLLKHLETLGYVSLRSSSVPSQERRAGGGGERAHIQLTVAGWEAVSPVAGTSVAGVCFVAMSFDPSLNDAFDHGMLPAIETDCGFTVVRLDRVEHNDDITDRILAGIRAAQFVVADFTGNRTAVYFEAGFAAGLGRTVIWTCRADDVANLSFDTRQQNHIRWMNPEDLRMQLTQRIRATVSLPARMPPARDR